MNKRALNPELRRFIYEMNGMEDRKPTPKTEAERGISKAPGEGQRRDTEASRSKEESPAGAEVNNTGKVMWLC